MKLAAIAGAMNMKKTIASLVLFFSCIGYFACGGGPVNATCVTQTADNDCCIAQADCDEYAPEPNATWPALEKACDQGTLVLCPTRNYIPDVKDCTFLKVQKACLGRTDAWTGKLPYTYDVVCCDVSKL